MAKVLLIEPFYAGSHKQLIDLLHDELIKLHNDGSSSGHPQVTSVHLATMPGKKWHWRARTSSLHFAQTIPKDMGFNIIFTSSVLPFHELLALRPEFQSATKILYFHENQLVYPVRKSKDHRDFQYGYNQVLSCLVADVILFNSLWNMESFLSNIQPFFKLQPDFRPTGLRSTIEPKCQVLNFPIQFERIPSSRNPEQIQDPIIRIVWPHRWEHDKNPELFFRVIDKLVEGGQTNFRLSVLGESFTDNPQIFTEAQSRLGPLIEDFGYLESKEDYYKVLQRSDIVISTADHEFFGVSMIEAVYSGCFPICPNKLVYPEIFTNSSNRFNSEEDLFRILQNILKAPENWRKSFQKRGPVCDLELYDWNKTLRAKFLGFILPKGS